MLKLRPPAQTPPPPAPVPVPVPSAPPQSAPSVGGGGGRQLRITDKFGVSQPQQPSAQVLQQQQQINDLRKRLDEETQKNLQTLEALRSVHERAEAAENETDITRKLYKKALMEQLKGRAKLEFEEARKELALNSLRYGTVRYERHGVRVDEVWHQGTLFDELRIKEAGFIENEKNVAALLVALKAEVKSKKKSKSAEWVKEMEEQEEIYIIQLAALKKKRDDVRVAFESMNLDLAQFKRELKRVRDGGRVALQIAPAVERAICADETGGKGRFQRGVQGLRFESASHGGRQVASGGSVVACQQARVVHEARHSRAADSAKRAPSAGGGRV